MTSQTHPSKKDYMELREWFLTNMSKLPGTLGNNYVYYNDLKKTVRGDIHIVDTVLPKLGPSGIHSNATARSAITRLQKTKDLLRDKSLWNNKKKVIGMFSNRIDVFKSSETQSQPSVGRLKEPVNLVLKEGHYVDVLRRNVAVIDGKTIPPHVGKAIEKLRNNGFTITKAII